MRAAVTLATSWDSGMSKSRIARGGMAPPHGLMRPALSSRMTEWPRLARSVAAVAPAGPPPTTTTSKVSCPLMAHPLPVPAAKLSSPVRIRSRSTGCSRP